MIEVMIINGKVLRKKRYNKNLLYSPYKKFRMFLKITAIVVLTIFIYIIICGKKNPVNKPSINEDEIFSDKVISDEQKYNVYVKDKNDNLLKEEAVDVETDLGTRYFVKDLLQNCDTVTIQTIGANLSEVINSE